MGKATNVEGVAFFDVKAISVNEWHPLADGQGEPEQVHLWVEVDGAPGPLVVRFKSGRPIDELVTALITHRRAVFGGAGNSQEGK